jgi:hypothetical protein
MKTGSFLRCAESIGAGFRRDVEPFPARPDEPYAVFLAMMSLHWNTIPVYAGIHHIALPKRRYQTLFRCLRENRVFME